MKKRVCRIVGWALLCVLIFTACGAPKESVNNIQQDPQLTVLDNPSGQKEIVMETVYYSFNWLPIAAKKFEEKTGVKVKIVDRSEDIEYSSIEIPDDSIQGYTVLDIIPYPDNSKYIERVTNDLMTGSGADIYDVQRLDFDNLGKNGLLCDLTEWVNSDQNLTEEKVFRNILLSAEAQEGLFAIPIQFNKASFGITSEAAPELENSHMTWREYFDTTKILGISNLVSGNSDLGIFIDRFLSKREEFINEEDGTQRLDSPEMIALLKECKKWGEEGWCRSTIDVNTFTMPCSYQYMSWGTPRAAQVLCNLPNNKIDGFSILGTDISDNKDLSNGGTIIGNLYGINANSPNKEIAQQFLQYLLSPEIQKLMRVDENMSYVDGLALNREALREQVEIDLQQIQKDNPDLKVYNEKDKYISEAEERLDQISKVTIQKPYYRELIYEVAKEYFLDKITAEEAAQRMADKVGLYLKEQG